MDNARRRRLTVALLLAGLAFGILAEPFPSPGMDLWPVVSDLAVGWAFIVCGAVVLYLRPGDRIGLLMAATGFAWFLGGILPTVRYLHRGPLVHLLLAFPAGRLPGRFARAVVLAAYVDGAIVGIATVEPVTIALAIAVVAAASWDLLHGSGPVRRGRAAGVVAAIALGAVAILASLDMIPGVDIVRSVQLPYEIVLVSLAVGLTWDLLRGGWSEAAVTGLVIELGERTETGTLRDRLASALGDPSLAIGYAVDETGGFVDEAGLPVLLPAPGSGRSVTPVGSDGDGIAVLVHDDAVLGDRVLVESVAAVARIAITNARLQAEIRDRVADLAASRRRIVEAGDLHRRRLEEDLQTGAGRRLSMVEALTTQAERRAAAPLAEAIGRVNIELREAESELRDFARGVYPTFLTERGLAIAVSELAHRFPLPVSVDLPQGRFPPLVEATGYFVCSEALTNVAKHAEASSVAIRATRSGSRLLLVINDDGIGGAEPRLGSGLRGLVDRVEALGGKVSVDSPVGKGTRLLADLPSA